MKSILLGSMLLLSAISPILTNKQSGMFVQALDLYGNNVIDFLLTDSESPSYKLLFGGVLGQELTNTTRQDEDISAAIQVHRHSTIVFSINCRSIR